MTEKEKRPFQASHRAGGGRTHTVSLPTDFKSVASAYSATAPCVQYFTIIQGFLTTNYISNTRPVSSGPENNRNPHQSPIRFAVGASFPQGKP